MMRARDKNHTNITVSTEQTFGKNLTRFRDKHSINQGGKDTSSAQESLHKILSVRVLPYGQRQKVYVAFTSIHRNERKAGKSTPRLAANRAGNLRPNGVCMCPEDPGVPGAQTRERPPAPGVAEKKGQTVTFKRVTLILDTFLVRMGSAGEGLSNRSESKDPRGVSHPRSGAPQDGRGGVKPRSTGTLPEPRPVSPFPTFNAE